MTDATPSASSTLVRSHARNTRRWVATTAVFVLLAAMAYDTTVVWIGSERDVQVQKFSPDAYGAQQFPLIRQSVQARATDALTLAQAIAADSKAAGEKYGGPTSSGPVIPVKLTGVVGERRANYHLIINDALPPDLTVRVQTGPALNGTDLRDATGKIEFGQFKNQIEYQDAGSAINNEVKKTVLANIDLSTLSGKTVTVSGVFKLVNPKSWIITPVRIDIQ